MATRALVADHSPVYTLWQVRGKCAAGEPRVVWVFQCEGGDVTAAAADSYFEALEQRVAATPEAFVTLYDFTLPLGNFLPFTAKFARSVNRLRGLLLRQVRTVVVCESQSVRSVLRLLIGLVGGTSPYVIVDTVDAGWREALAAQRDKETGVQDCFDGSASLTEGLDPRQVALGASQMASVLADAGNASE